MPDALPLRCRMPFALARGAHCSSQHSRGADMWVPRLPFVPKKGGMEPDGQRLPDWLSYSEYTTTTDGVVVTTGTVVQLSQTYYGPSIPLGTGWVYGGETSPAASSAATATASVTASQTELPESSTATPTPSETRPDTTLTAASFTREEHPESFSTSPTSGNSGSISLSSSSTSSTASDPASMPSPLTPPGVETTSTSIAPSATSTSTSSSHHNSLIPLFPALFVPLFVLFVVLLLLLACYYRRRHSRPPGPDSPSKFAWLSTLARRPKAAGYTPAPAKPTDPRSPPTEKSALLKGFMAQHHRHSSSLTSLPRQSAEDEVDDDLADLVQQNQSLLQRLTLGLGWVSPVERRTSGNMVEKTAGLGLGVATAAAGTSDAKHARDVTGATGQTGASSSGQPTTSPTSAGYEPVLTNDELFYHPPETGSSGAFNTDTTTSGQTRSTGSRPGRPSSGSAPGAFPWGSRGAAGAGKQGKDEQEDDHGDMGEFGNRRGWAASLLRFPAPPGWRNSVVSSEGSFHTAAEDSLPRSPTAAVAAARARPHTPSHGHPLSRTEENYAHAPLSAFGSAPNTPSGSPPKFTSPLLPASHSPSPARSRRNLDARPPRSGSPLQREQSSVPKRQSGLHEEIDVASPILPSTPSGFTLEAGEAETSDSHHTLGPKLTLPLFINSPGGASSASATSPTGQEERSYTGEPLVQRTKSGSGWQMRKSSYGDFGEPLRNVSSRNAPNLSRQATMASEAASVHSSAHGSSGKSSGSHGSGRDIDLTRALRGRRSQGMLLRASTIGKPKV